MLLHILLEDFSWQFGLADMDYKSGKDERQNDDAIYAILCPDDDINDWVQASSGNIFQFTREAHDELRYEHIYIRCPAHPVASTLCHSKQVRRPLRVRLGLRPQTKHTILTARVDIPFRILSYYILIGLENVRKQRKPSFQAKPAVHVNAFASSMIECRIRL